MSLSVVDAGKHQRIRGALVSTVSAQSSVVTWVDLTDATQIAGLPSNLRNCTINPLRVSAEGTWTGGQIDLYVSLSDTTPLTALSKCPIAQSFTAPNFISLPSDVRWLGWAIPTGGGLTGGTVSLFVSGVLGG